MASEKYASDPPSSWNQKLKPSPTSDMKESDGETANASTAKATATSKTYTKTSDTNAAASENTAAIPPNNSTVLAAGLSNMEAVDTEELYGDLTNSPLVKTSQEKRNLLQNKRLLVNHQTCQQVTNGAVFTENHDEMVVGQPYPYRDHRDRGPPPEPYHDRMRPPRGGYYPEGDRDFRGGRGDMGPRDFHRDGPRNGYRDGPRDGYGGPGPPEHCNGPPGPYGPYPPRGAGERGERRRRDEGPPGVCLFVRNLPNDIEAQELQNVFGRIGVIRKVCIPRDFHSQQPKGFAFIEYASPDMAREARSEMDKFVIKGSQLEVVFAQERRKTPNEMRGRVADAHSRRSPEPGERGGGGGFERSSSFERHRQKKRERRDNDCPPVKREDDAPPKGDQEGPH